MTKVESAARWMENLARDNTHGYSQQNRWGPDYDCSSAIITAYEQAGVPVKTSGATYTGNMRQSFLKSGFYDVTSDVNLASGDGMKRGDVLLNEADHTAMYVGGRMVVHARGTDGHPEPGDQTGNEIRIQTYWNFPWDCVLRYPDSQPEEGSAGDPEQDDIIHSDYPREYAHLQYGSGIGSPSYAVKAWQNLLLGWGYNLGNAGADGEYGGYTETATRKWQADVQRHGVDVEINGIVDEDDWQEIVRFPEK